MEETLHHVGPINSSNFEGIMGRRGGAILQMNSLVAAAGKGNSSYSITWVVVKIMVPFWVPIIIRHLIFRVPKIGP